MNKIIYTSTTIEMQIILSITFADP